jgi:hypothetical protein
MIFALLLLAVTVVPVNDPLAPLQLLHADVSAHGDELRVCVTVRNESPQIVRSVQISGTIRDDSQSVTAFVTAGSAAMGKDSGVPPGGEFRTCGSAPGITLRGHAVVQVMIR